ncbi:MAG: DUF4124 domain-containing protein [Burkholderiaceae bacterium]
MTGRTLRNSLVKVAIVLVGLAGVTSALAQWKWLDKSRQVQYSDIPPPFETPERDILQRPKSPTAAAPTPALAAAPAASAASGAGIQAKTVEPELEAKRRKAEQDQAARAKSEAKAEEERVVAMRTENCNRARADVRTLDDGGRLARSNVRGEREVLDDRQRAEELRRTRDLIAALCR